MAKNAFQIVLIPSASVAPRPQATKSFVLHVCIPVVPKTTILIPDNLKFEFIFERVSIKLIYFC